MFNRQKTDTSVKTAKGQGGSAGPQAFSRVEDLLRRADWETLGDTDRTALLAAIGSPALTSVTDGDKQEWVARLVAARFQPEAAAGITAWLNTTSGDGHLYLGGHMGQGRTSLVASLARQAAAKLPPPPEYCYVPTPDAMDGPPVLLPLPRGTSATFGKTMGQALGPVFGNWDDAAGQKPSDPSQPAPLKQLITGAFSAIEGATPDSARAYVAQLRAAFEKFADAGGSLPYSWDDVPVAHIQPVPDTAPGAPVVVATLARTELQDALLRANGGVLILAANELGQDSWGTLATALKTRELLLKPGWPAVPATVRVALVGTGDAYDALNGGAEDFARLFRYEVWCNDATEWTREAEGSYAALASGVASIYQVPACDASGVARLIEEGARRAGNLNRTYLSTDLLLLRDLATEAGRLAQAQGASATTGAQVDAALQLRRSVQSVNARRVRDAIMSGQEITPTAGTAVGQINGLGVYAFHPSEGNFAVPMRISATVSPGRDEKLVDIEHEAQQADADHVRGALTVEGYIAQRYGQVRPITAVGRIRFEQEHGGTGGDSASAALLVALLSALSQVPIRNSLAITGAVGQYGEIQPIGEVNAKIEGFWELCKLRRAQGEQAAGGYGVLIPAVNARDLMLRADVAKSIAREGWFHVYPITTVDDALVLLTGAPAETIHTRVNQQLQRFHDAEVRSRTGR